MSNPLPRMVRVTGARKCPVCGKPTWCLVSPDGKAAICNRVESKRKCGEAGWLHRLEEPVAAFVPPPKPEPAKRGDWFEQAQRCAVALPPKRKSDLSVSLGLPPDGLNCINLVGLHEDTVTFPERDGSGKVIGLNRRYPDGRKLHMPGGSRGLTLPIDWINPSSMMLVVEGPTDTAACVAAGINAIGRPSNRGGVAMLGEAINRWVELDRTIVVAGENDKRWNAKTERWDWPGLVGCLAVAGELSAAVKNEVKWALPPTDYKDVRDYLTGEMFAGVAWIERGVHLLQDMQVHDAKHIPDGYARYAEEAAKAVGYDESRWRY